MTFTFFNELEIKIAQLFLPRIPEVSYDQLQVAHGQTLKNGSLLILTRIGRSASVRAHTTSPSVCAFTYLTAYGEARVNI